MWSDVDVVVDHLVQVDVDSLGYDVRLVNPDIEVVPDLLVEVLVDLLALDVLVFDCEVDVHLDLVMPESDLDVLEGVRGSPQDGRSDPGVVVLIVA